MSIDITNYTPTKEFLNRLEKLSEGGVKVEFCGPLLELTTEEMEYLYNNNRDVKLSYQRGLSKLSLKVSKKMNDLAFTDDDFKALEYYATNIAGLKIDKTKKVEQKSIAPESSRSAFNPAMLLEDDEEEDSVK